MTSEIERIAAEPCACAMLTRDHARMRMAGGKLADAASRVVHEYDGLHRLALAIADWHVAIAGEGDRAHLRTPAPMLMTQEWLDAKVAADPVAEVEACTPAGEAGEMVEYTGHPELGTPDITRLSNDTEAMRLLRRIEANGLRDHSVRSNEWWGDLRDYLARIDALAKGGAS